MGDPMKRMTRQFIVAVSAVVVVVASVIVISKQSHGTHHVDFAGRCASSPRRCVYVAPGQPLLVGTWFNGATDDGVDEANAVAMALDYLHNATFNGISGTLLGHPVQTVPVNDDCGATSGVRAAETLVKANVVAVIGPSCSASVYHAGASTLAKHHVLTISPEAGSHLLTQSPLEDPYFFRVGRNDALQAAAIADYAVTSLHAGTIGIVAEPDAYSLPLATAIANDIQGKSSAHVAVVAQGQHPLAAARALAQLHPSVIILPVNNGYCSALPQAFRQLAALRTVPIVLAQACQERGVLADLAGGDANIVAVGPDFQQELANLFYVHSFIPAYRDLYGANPVSIYNTFTWDATNILFQAIDDAAVRLPNGGLSIDRVALRNAMLNIQNYPGLSGELSCSTSGDCVNEARVALYRAPAWPAAGDLNATPVFSETAILSDALVSAGRSFVHR